MTLRSHRPDHLRKQDLSMARIDFNLNLLRDPERQTQVTNRFRIVTFLSSPSSGPRIARLSKINLSLNRDSIHANCIESPVIIKSSPCTNPHILRSRQHTIAGDHVPMTKTTNADHSLRRFTCHVHQLDFSDQVFALHLFFRKQLNRRLTGRFCLSVCSSKHPRTRSSESSHHLHQVSTSALW